MDNPGHKHRKISACVRLATADCESVLELGSGFGDRLANADCDHKTGIEIHAPYVELAKRNFPGPTYICGDALEEIDRFDPRSVDAIILSDFLEHLEKEAGLLLLGKCKRIICKRILIFGPDGDLPSPPPKSAAMRHWTKGLGGEEEMRHKSQWTAEDLPGFDVAIWPNYFKKQKPGTGALFAIWEPGQ